jgi:putative copper export protein
VIAATIWVGGQFTLAGLVPALRGISDDAPRIVARRFNRLAWPAYGVLVLTGVWNLFAVDFSDTTTRYQVTVMVKITVVAIAGIAAFLHTRATSKAGLAIGGAASALSSTAALLLGVMLHG